MKIERKLIHVDLDGVLCHGVCWTPTECLNAKPNLKMIIKVNHLFQRNYIIIYTARRDRLIPVTIQWLRKNEVLYHAISNLKNPTDFYVDDCMLSMKEFLKST